MLTKKDINVRSVTYGGMDGGAWAGRERGVVNEWQI